VVANGGISEQIARRASVRFDLAPNPLHKRPHVIRLVTILAARDSVQYLPVQHDLACVPREVREHLELAPSQLHVGPIEARATSVEIHLQTLVAVRWRVDESDMGEIRASSSNASANTVETRVTTFSDGTTDQSTDANPTPW
jgi:hypothetical protein